MQQAQRYCNLHPDEIRHYFSVMETWAGELVLYTKLWTCKCIGDTGRKRTIDYGSCMIRQRG